MYSRGYGAYNQSTRMQRRLQLMTAAMAHHRWPLHQTHHRCLCSLPILRHNSRASYHACGCAVPLLRPPPPPRRLRPFHRLPPRRTLPKRPSVPSIAGARIKCANGSLRAMPTLSRTLPPFERTTLTAARSVCSRERICWTSASNRSATGSLYCARGISSRRACSRANR